MEESTKEPIIGRSIVAEPSPRKVKQAGSKDVAGAPKSQIEMTGVAKLR
jgi:hypothetical protein